VTGELRAEWPKYRIIIDGMTEWLPLRRAGIAYDCGWCPVSIGGQVMEEDGSVRDITKRERQRIADIADDYSGSK
jgi:hypothetical protein